MQTDDKQDEEPYLDGWHFMLRQPEFAHSQQMLALMELVEERRLVSIIFSPELENPGVQVVIGKENEAEAFHNYSLVISQYGLPGEAVGSIGIIGPTRMPYARTISNVSYVSSLLSDPIKADMAVGPIFPRTFEAIQRT